MTNKLTLIVNRPTDAGDDEKTAAHPRRRPKHGGRRRVRPRINFWDLGMVNTGTAYNQWEMLEFQPSIPGSFATSTAAFDDTYHNELLDKIFEVPVEDWKSHYKRIVPEMDYGIQVAAVNESLVPVGSVETLDSDNPNFTNAGLKADPEWFNYSGYYPAINALDTSAFVAFGLTYFGEASFNKITTAYDINADAVEFVPSKQMHIYLVPSLPQMRGRLNYNPGGGTQTQQLNDFFHLYDRSLFLNPAHPLYAGGAFVTGSYLGLSGTGGLSVYDAATYARFMAIKEYMQAFDGARGRYSTDLGATWPTSDDGSNFASVVSPGYPTTVGLNVDNLVSLIAGNSTSFQGNPNNQTRLRCVIRQDGAWYYVWNVAYT
jgi:hypothetical protein